MFGRIVMDVKAERFDHALEAAQGRAQRGRPGHGPRWSTTCKALVEEFKAIVREDTGRDFPTDPNEQLDLAIKAVFASWFGKRARDYRESQKIADDLGTAVNVVTMVFGNMGDDSGTGVAFTRDPNTGENDLFGEYLTNAQGEDVVAGIRTRAEDRPDGDRHAGRLRRVPADRPAARAALPRRPGPRVHDRAGPPVHAPDAVRQADRRGRRADRGRHGRRGHRSRRRRRSPGSSRPTSTSSSARRSTRPRSRAPRRSSTASTPRPGAAVGRAVFDADDAVEWVSRGEQVILVRIETSPDDFHGMAVSQGIITARGGATSHAAVVARQIGKPCVAGSADLMIDYAAKGATCAVTGTSFKEGDWVSLDGSTGALYQGALPTVEARFEDQPELQTILGWADGIRRMGVWTNADKPEEAAQARSLRRPGHRPLPDRAHVPRGRAARDRPGRDPRRPAGDPGEGEARRRAAEARRPASP